MSPLSWEMQDQGNWPGPGRGTGWAQGQTKGPDLLLQPREAALARHFPAASHGGGMKCPAHSQAQWTHPTVVDTWEASGPGAEVTGQIRMACDRAEPREGQAPV